jgi:Trk K+ transport system NAD-binding subunit
VGDVEMQNLVKIAAIRRGGQVLIPSAYDALAAGDEINAIVAPEALSEFVARFAAEAVKLSA